MPNDHTRLINYIIGFCKEDPLWVCPLKKLKYKPQIIEQTISLSDGTKVTPDIVLSSNRLAHILVCECKGGSTVSMEQATRYKKLTTSDLSRWVRLPTGEMSHDVCYVMFETNMNSAPNTFPVLTFSDHVKKHGEKFGQHDLETVFSQAIHIGNLQPTLSYYPFSANDDMYDITAYVLRAVVSLVQQNCMPSEDTKQLDEILKKSHNMYKLLSQKHKNELKKKINDVIIALNKKYPDFKDCLRYKHHRSTIPSNFVGVCNKILHDIKSTARIDDFVDGSQK